MPLFKCWSKVQKYLKSVNVSLGLKGFRGVGMSRRGVSEGKGCYQLMFGRLGCDVTNP